MLSRRCGTSEWNRAPRGKAGATLRPPGPSEGRGLVFVPGRGHGGMVRVCGAVRCRFGLVACSRCLVSPVDGLREYKP